MDCQKHLFSLPDNHHYLNCAFLSPLLEKVEKAGIEGIKAKNRPWEMSPDDFFTDSAQLRSLFARLINAERGDEIAILPAVSYGLATVAKNIDPKKGNHIIVAGEQFPSNVYAWQRFCENNDCELKIIDAPASFENRGELWNGKLIDAIDSDTLMVALGNVHWTDGTLFDLESIGEKARAHDAYLAIDGTQSVGALPFDVQKVQPDALICAGYKWLMGPYAITLGYFGPRLQDGIPLEEGWITRKNSENFSDLVDYEHAYQPGSIRFDMGERSNFILVPMMIEALKQILEWGPENIQQYCGNITSELVEKLPEYGYRLEDSEWRANHILGLRLPEHIWPQKLKSQLDKQNIHVSLRGSAVRVAPNVYNDKHDISMLADLLKEFA